MNVSAVRARGFTLLEILVVVVIIAVLTAMLVPNLASGGRWREIAREADTLSARLREAQQDAMLYGREYGIVLAQDGYRFVAWDAAKQGFFAVSDTSLPWLERRLPEGITLSAETADARDTLTLPEPQPDTGKAATTQEKEKPEQPTVYVLSSGEVTPFAVTIRADGEDNEARVAFDALGNRLVDDGGSAPK